MQNKYSLKFKEASLTGSKVLILKGTTKCDCYDENRLIDSEPKPDCPKCFGTGLQRQAILSSKIRNEINNAYNQQFETTDKNTTINEKRKFYFPLFYSEITTEDYLCLLDADEKTIISVYKIINKEQFRDYDFIFYEIVGKKINFIKKFKLEDFEELKNLHDDNLDLEG